MKPLLEDETRWRSHHSWALARRVEILNRVADEVVRQKTPRNRAEVAPQRGTIYIR